MTKKLPKEISKIITQMKEILGGYLATISKAIAPYSLNDLVGELRPKGIAVAVIGAEKRWYARAEAGGRMTL